MPLYPPEFFLSIPDEREVGGEHNADVVPIEFARVRSFIARLPERERRVVELRFGFDGPVHTIDEVASRLRIGVGTVCRAERHALVLLRGMYGIAGDLPVADAA